MIKRDLAGHVKPELLISPVLAIQTHQSAMLQADGRRRRSMKSPLRIA